MVKDPIKLGDTTVNSEYAYWASLKKGNVDALGRLYDLYVDELFAFGMSIAPDKSMVMDGIHDLFLNLYKYRGNLAEVSNIKAYLLRALKTTIIKKGGNKIIPCDNANKVYQMLPNNPNTDSHEDMIISHENDALIRDKMNRAMALLSKNQQKVLRMRFDENKSYEEIAESLSVSIASARTIIYRAIKILRGGVLMLYFLLS